MQIYGIVLTTLLAYAMPVNAIQDPAFMQEDKQQVNGWTQFFNSLLNTHHWYQKNHSIRQVSAKGGYATNPDFYREVSYYDKDSNRLLSRIQWVKDKPEVIHMIEVFMYDEQGRMSRDYLAAYLPGYRNAPVQTLINFHNYNDALHAYRQFDASGALIYEQCQGRYFNEDITFSIEEHEFEDYQDETSDTFQTYLACFEMLPKELGQYVHPYQAELKQMGWKNQRPDIKLSTYEDMDKFVSTVTEQLVKEPNNIKWYLARGDAYFKLHEFEKAVADFSRALSIDKDSSPAWFGRGMAYGRLGQIDKGIADLSEFIKRNPSSSLAYTKRGVRYLWKGDRSNAEKDFRTAIKLNSNNAEAHDDLGVIHAQRGELEQAIKHFTTTIKIDPAYLKGFHNLAMAHHLAGNHPRALEMVNQALAIKSDEKVSLLLKSQILSAQGQHQQAAAIQDKAEFLPDGNWSELAPSH